MGKTDRNRVFLIQPGINAGLRTAFGGKGP